MIKNQINTLLKQYYGYDSFRKGQEEIINHILAGRDVLGIMPTGGGKSICYQIPALVLEGVTIVISPLISLMKDQVDTLCEMGIKAVYINSLLSNEQLNEVIRNAKDGIYKIVYVAPERLETESFITLLNSINISMITVDEAHCASQWGHDFRPSYTRIAHVIKRMNKRPIVSAFTATATLEVKEDLIHILELDNPYVLLTGFDRDNLYLEVVKPQNKMKYLIEYLNKNKNVSGIIYCSTRKTVEMVNEKLSLRGYHVTKYHAGLSEQERTNNQEDFLYDRKQIMVATNAFGMGIDKSNIRYVIHYNMPKNMESYYQEAGRAGRDGLESECILCYSAADIVTNKFFINNNNTEIAANEYKKLNDITDYCNTDKCLRSYILTYFGETEVEDKCDHCANCNNNSEETDITTESQKIMSCIKRMNERFGASMITDVLRGTNNKKVRELGFNTLPTYGIMKEYHSDSIKEIISYLVTENFLRLNGNQYPTLSLTPKSYEVLLGKQLVSIKRVIEKTKPEHKQKAFRKFDETLFELLRDLRLKVAKKQGVPPFIIFTDASLQDMSRKYPTTNEAFLTVTGVGENKLLKYGNTFIQLIEQYMKDKKPHVEEEVVVKSKVSKANNTSSLETYELHKNNLTIDEIAKERNLSIVTIQNHLIECHQNGCEINFDQLISTEFEIQIIEVIKEIGTDKLKPIKEALPDSVSYEDIKFTICKHNL